MQSVGSDCRLVPRIGWAYRSTKPDIATTPLSGTADQPVPTARPGRSEGRPYQIVLDRRDSELVATIWYLLVERKARVWDTDRSPNWCPLSCETRSSRPACGTRSPRLGDVIEDPNDGVFHARQIAGIAVVDPGASSEL